jgi:hypothetical protein
MLGFKFLFKILFDPMNTYPLEDILYLNLLRCSNKVCLYLPIVWKSEVKFMCCLINDIDIFKFLIFFSVKNWPCDRQCSTIIYIVKLLITRRIFIFNFSV